jgi:hypothetical protein
MEKTVKDNWQVRHAILFWPKIFSSVEDVQKAAWFVEQCFERHTKKMRNGSSRMNDKTKHEASDGSE